MEADTAPAHTNNGLVAEQVTAGYGPLRAISEVSIRIPDNRVVGIVGPNGAGKTTLLRSLAGVIIPSSGRVLWQGADVTRSRADDRARHGIAFVQEGRHLFGSLPVRDNLLMGAYGRKRVNAMREGLDRVLALFPPLEELLKRSARTLSGGEQQMVAIGRALMGSPRCLLIDEPSLGLAPIVIDNIYGTLPDLCKSDVSVGIVEQEVERILNAADHIYVMRDGEVVGAGPSERIRRDPRRLGDLYLGTV